jgi:hypothetical protein
VATWCWISSPGKERHRAGSGSHGGTHMCPRPAPSSALVGSTTAAQPAPCAVGFSSIVWACGSRCGEAAAAENHGGKWGPQCSHVDFFFFILLQKGWLWLFKMCSV